MELNIKFKRVMNSQEIRDWEDGIFFRNSKGVYEFNQWSLSIHFDCFNQLQIRVYGYNGICFGKFELDNGFLKNEEYYPIMRFFNKLSFSERGWVCSDALCANVEFGSEEFCELNLEKIFEAVNESWYKIKQFLQ